jgi:hypothetical protein
MHSPDVRARAGSTPPTGRRGDTSHDIGSGVMTRAILSAAGKG